MGIGIEASWIEKFDERLAGSIRFLGRRILLPALPAAGASRAPPLRATGTFGHLTWLGDWPTVFAFSALAAIAACC